jgi:redox-sensitive bicupin YhaK (pirin superfamily)
MKTNIIHSTRLAAVMNSRAEIQQAFEDYQLGHMGELAP